MSTIDETARKILKQGVLNSNAGPKLEDGLLEWPLDELQLARFLDHPDPVRVLAEAIAAEMDWGFDEIAEDTGSEEEAMRRIASSVAAELASGFYDTEGHLELRRVLRTTASDECLRLEGTAQDVGTSWSDGVIGKPDFLTQYGEEGGRDVVLVASVPAGAVDLFATLWKRLDPATADYREVVLRKDAIVTASVDADAPAPGP